MRYYICFRNLTILCAECRRSVGALPMQTDLHYNCLRLVDLVESLYILVPAELAGGGSGCNTAIGLVCLARLLCKRDLRQRCLPTPARDCQEQSC